MLSRNGWALIPSPCLVFGQGLPRKSVTSLRQILRALQLQTVRQLLAAEWQVLSWRGIHVSPPRLLYMPMATWASATELGLMSWFLVLCSFLSTWKLTILTTTRWGILMHLIAWCRHWERLRFRDLSDLCGLLQPSTDYFWGCCLAANQVKKEPQYLQLQLLNLPDFSDSVTCHARLPTLGVSMPSGPKQRFLAKQMLLSPEVCWNYS